MTEDEAVTKAMQSAVRDEDGNIDVKALIGEVAALVELDEAEERHKKATRAVRRRQMPAYTEPHGQLRLPGIDEAYGYEPDRLIADNAGHVIEQARARPPHKQAEAERARRSARRQQAWADRKATESEAFSAWVLQQTRLGRLYEPLTFDAFVHETNLWSPGQADPEPVPPADDQ